MIEFGGENNNQLNFLKTPNWLKKAHNFSLITLTLLLLASLFLPWQQTSLGEGRVIAFSPNDRVQSITATVEGRISRWYINEGQKVNQGDILVEITDNDPDLMAKFEIERSSMRSRMAALIASVETASKNIKRQKSLFDQGLSSERQYELARLDYMKHVGDRSNAEAELARLDIKISRQETQIIKASRTGTIQRIIVHDTSSVVKPGEVLATLVPQTEERTAEILISGMDLPFITEQQEVLLQFEGWPSIQFSGWPQATIGTYLGKVKLIDPSDSGTGQFRVLVAPFSAQKWPSSRLLKQGVRVKGYIQLNRVPLWFELWRRLNGFPKSLPEEQIELLNYEKKNQNGEKK